MERLDELSETLHALLYCQLMAGWASAEVDACKKKTEEEQEALLGAATVKRENWDNAACDFRAQLKNVIIAQRTAQGIS
jgi:hypothetical protein